MTENERLCETCLPSFAGEIRALTERAEKAEAALDEANALLHPIEWWVCVWCDARFPYDDGPDALKAHSAICSQHPARALADKLLDLYIQAYCAPEKFWDCGDPFCVEARERLPAAALAKWEER